MNKKTLGIIGAVSILGPLVIFFLVNLANGGKCIFSADAVLSFYGTMYAGIFGGMIAAYALYMTIKQNNISSKQQYEQLVFNDQLKDTRLALTIIMDIDTKVKYIVDNKRYSYRSKEIRNTVFELQSLARKLEVIKQTVLMTYVSELSENEQKNLCENKSTENSQQMNRKNLKEFVDVVITPYISSGFYNNSRWNRDLEDLKSCLQEELDFFNYNLEAALSARKQAK